MNAEKQTWRKQTEALVPVGQRKRLNGEAPVNQGDATVEGKLFTRHGLALAMTIGDGSVRGKKHHALEFCHCLAQTQYAIWKWRLLQRYVHHGSKWNFDKNRDGSNRRIRVRTPAHHRLTSVFKKLYGPEGKRIAPDTLERMTPFCVAIWYMDDGSATWRDKTRHGNPVSKPFVQGISLATHCFTEGENKMIADWFLSRYGINFRVVPEKRKQQFFIRTTKKVDVAKFLELVGPTVMKIPCMHYKIGVGRTLASRTASNLKDAEGAETTPRLNVA